MFILYVCTYRTYMKYKHVMLIITINIIISNLIISIIIIISMLTIPASASAKASPNLALASCTSAVSWNHHHLYRFYWYPRHHQHRHCYYHSILIIRKGFRNLSHRLRPYLSSTNHIIVTTSPSYLASSLPSTLLSFHHLHHNCHPYHPHHHHHSWHPHNHHHDYLKISHLHSVDQMSHGRVKCSKKLVFSGPNLIFIIVCQL